nr:MAG TPA: hypothetical protein [Caudoviricetes sp.]
MFVLPCVIIISYLVCLVKHFLIFCLTLCDFCIIILVGGDNKCMSK